MTAAVYLRKSRAEEFHAEDTLKRHREILLDYAARSQITVLKIYEEVISGESLYTRPQMLALLADVEHGDYDAVLCMDIDRLGRGAMSDQGVILETLKAADTKIITPRKLYDLNNETDETYSEFETFLARQELKSIKRRMQRGIQKTIQEGGYVANAPYGYRRATAEKKPTLAIEEDEARFVRMIFDLYVNHGMGCQHIADTISAMGAKPHRADRFGRTSVMKILHSATYTGKIIWNRKTKSSNGHKTVQIANSKEKWTVVNGLHPAIISNELFEQAQAIARTRRHPPAASGSVQNPLAGLIFCARCGSPMQRQITRDGACLICRKPGCTASSSLPAVEEAVLKQLRPLLEKIIIHRTAADFAETERRAEWSRTAEREMSLLAHQKAALHDLLEQGVYDHQTFSQRQSLLNDKINRLKQAANTLPAPVKAKSYAPTDTYMFYLNLPPKLQNLLLKAVVERIVYQKEKGALPFSFQLEMLLKPFCL